MLVNSALLQGPVAVAAVEHPDTVLVGRVRAGDEAAFEQLYLRYRDRVTRMVANIVRDSAATPDLVQEIFTKAYFAVASSSHRRLGVTSAEFRAGSPFRPWLYKVATNHCLDHLRRQGRRPFHLTIEDEWTADETGAVVPVADSVDALKQLVSRDLVQKLLRMLKPRDRVLLVMKEIEELSLEEMSEVTGMGVTAVKVALFRARRRMLDRYQKMLGASNAREAR
jgi:RNA polymerase sigma-70 factor (ECF subfamily)